MKDKKESVEEVKDVVMDEVIEEVNLEESSELNEDDMPEEEVSPEERLQQLKHFRTNGGISINVSYNDFKFIVNTFRDKVEWKGPNEAYLLMILNMGLNNAMAQFEEKKSKTEEQMIQISNSSIEFMNRFQHRISGKNSHAAGNYMGLFGVVSHCTSQLESVDKEIESLKDELGLSDEEEKTEKNS